jgi:outer membrane protein OmpA-like peptidoglycan-associated protein
LQQSGGSAGAILQKACDPAALSTRKELIYFPMERSLRKVLEGKWILKKGSSSYQANGLIQQALVDMGYNLGTTGRNKDGIDKAFKGKTVDAIKEFQTKIMNKATPNGYLDKDTLLCLDDARAKTSVAKHLPGSIKDEQVQVLGEGHSSGDDGATARIYFARGDATLDIEDTISIFETLSNKHLKGKSLQLDGYVSEQERNEYGSNLAKKRNEAVKKDLVYFGVDQAKINTTEKVDAGKGQAKYRGLQKVEISEQGSKTNTADCSKGSAKKRSLNATEEPVANKSIDEAVKYVDKAMSDATMDSKKGEKAIGTFFGSVSKKSKVKRNLKKWHKHLDKNVKRRKRRGTKCDAGCTSAIAYNNNTGSRAMMTLCESFFEDASVKHIYKDLTAEQGRAMIIAHEAGHGSIDTEDVAYDTRRLIKFVHESPDLALKNTDSYIFYIRCVNGLGSSCAPPDRKDMISGGLSAGELTNAKRGVAWLGTWLEWAYQDIIGLYSDSAESRDKKKWTDEYYLQNILPLVEKTFKLHRPKDVMTTAGEQQIFAAIGDRYRSMILVSEKPLELDKDSASSAATKWEKGSGRPGKKVTFAKDYLALTTNRARVEKLLPLIIQATPIIASSLHGAYESFVKLTVKETWEDKP